MRKRKGKREENKKIITIYKILFYFIVHKKIEKKNWIVEKCTLSKNFPLFLRKIFYFFYFFLYFMNSSDTIFSSWKTLRLCLFHCIFFFYFLLLKFSLMVSLRNKHSLIICFSLFLFLWLKIVLRFLKNIKKTFFLFHILIIFTTF